MNSSEQIDPSNTPKTSVLRILLGLALVLPALGACIATELVPGIGLFLTSLTNSNGLNKGAYVGFANYSRLFSDASLGTAVGFTLLELLVNLLLVLIIPVLLAWAAQSMGRVVRVIARILYSVPMALYVHVAIAIVWPMLFSPSMGLTQQSLLSNPATARLTFLAIDGIYTLGLMCGLGLIFFLPAFQQPEDQGTRKWLKPLLVSWGVGLLTTAAFSIQSFTLNFGMTNGGPANSTLSLMLYSFHVSFVTMRFGYGSAISIAVMLVLGVLGIAATSILIFNNLKFSLMERKATTVPAAGRPAGSSGLVILIIILVLVVSLPAILAEGGAFILAFARGQNYPGAASHMGGALALAKVFVNTTLPAFVSSFVIQLPIAYLGALGIGAMRPLGKRSE
jgi:ABC-type sugar transport system permease subunit